MRLPDPLGHPLIQRLDHIRDIPAPHGLCGPGNLKALPLENIFQPIEWQVIGELAGRSEEHTSELQSHSDLVCRLLLEKKNRKRNLHRSPKTRDQDRTKE